MRCSFYVLARAATVCGAIALDERRRVLEKKVKDVKALKISVVCCLIVGLIMACMMPMPSGPLGSAQVEELRAWYPLVTSVYDLRVINKSMISVAE